MATSVEDRAWDYLRRTNSEVYADWCRNEKNGNWDRAVEIIHESDGTVPVVKKEPDEPAAP